MSERDGAATRRRERRLRSWAKHERQTVAMAPAEALHHSAPRRPKTASARMRPGVLEDPEPRRETEHGLYAAPRGLKPPSPGVPSLATPLLAGQATEVLDASTLAFLTRAVLEEKKKAEVEKEERMRRQRRQSLVQDALFAVPAWNRSDAEFSRIETLASEHRSLDSTSSSSSSQPGRRKRKKKRKKKVRSSRVHQRQVPAVRSVHLLALVLPVATQRQVPIVHSFMLPVQLVDKVLDVPVVVLRQVPGSMVQKTGVVPQLQFITVVDTPFVAQMLIPMVLAAMESPQLRVDRAVDASIMQVVQVIGVPFATQRSIPIVLVTIEISLWPWIRWSISLLCRTCRFPCCGA